MITNQVSYEETEENGKLLKNTLFVKKLQIFLIDLFVLLWDYYMPWRIMFLYFKLQKMLFLLCTELTPVSGESSVHCLQEYVLGGEGS